VEKRSGYFSRDRHNDNILGYKINNNQTKKFLIVFFFPLILNISSQAISLLNYLPRIKEMNKGYSTFPFLAAYN